MATTTMAQQAVLGARAAASTSGSRARVQPFTSRHAMRGAALVARPSGAVAAQQRAACLVTRAYEENEDSAYEADDSFQERVVQVRRVTKVVKGGKQLSFRAVVIVGDEAGTVGVGCASAKEVVQAVKKAVVDAKRNLISVPLNKNNSFPHRFDGYFGAAKVMLRPAAEGTGVIAGGAVRVVLELAGVKNAFGKQLGTDNPLNNARATIEGLKAMRTFRQVAAERGVTVEYLMGAQA